MLWTDEKINQLRLSCCQGKSNKEIAEILGVSITDVYAKRSQLGITIAKVSAGPIGKTEYATKVVFLESLTKTLKLANVGVKNLKLDSSGNSVFIIFKNGNNKKVCIECDSELAIILDIVGSLQ